MAVAAAVVAAASIGYAQAPLNSPVTVILNILTVNDNLDRALEFYHHLLGLQSADADPRARLAWYPQAPQLDDMYSIRSDTRNFFLKIPGSDLILEPEQFSASKAKRLDTHVQDPGAVQLTFYTRDLDTLTGWLVRGGAKVLTRGGKPVRVETERGSAREVLVEDFNGFFVKLVERQNEPKPDPAPGLAPSPYINGATIGIAVQDIEKTVRFYREALGIAVTVPASFVTDAQEVSAFGLTGAQYRESVAALPDKTPPLHFFEFKGVTQKPLHPAIADPNAVVIRFNVPNIEAAMAKAKAAGASVISASGGITVFGRNHFLMLKDPDGINLQLTERFPAP